METKSLDEAFRKMFPEDRQNSLPLDKAHALFNFAGRNGRQFQENLGEKLALLAACECLMLTGLDPHVAHLAKKFLVEASPVVTDPVTVDLDPKGIARLHHLLKTQPGDSIDYAVLRRDFETAA